MIPGAGTAGLPSSSPARPRGPAAAPSCGSDVCRDCGALLSLSVRDEMPLHYGPRRCSKCKVGEDQARSEAPDASDSYGAFTSELRRVAEAIGLEHVRDWITRGAIDLPAGMTVDEACDGVRFEWKDPSLSRLDPLKLPPGTGGPGESLAPFGAALSAKGDNMASSTLRAYLCTHPTCGMMGMDLAQYVAGKGKALLMLPADWLDDPESAGDGYRRLAHEDRELVLRRGQEITFPILFIDSALVNVETEIIRESNWLEFSRK